jgi:CheY-like chemotaxis protein
VNIKVVYIDDADRELQKYKAKFEADERTKGRFVIMPHSSPKSSQDYNRIRQAKPDLLLVDYDLSIPDENGNVIGISGVTLATELRQKFPEIPIVLFTRKSVFKVQDYTSIKETLSSIDEIVYKQDVFKSESPKLEDLFQLAVGFKKLRKIKSGQWNDLLKLMRASQGDSDALSLCDPPVVPKQGWAAAAVATWVRNVVLRYPGVLYDPVHAATFLGVSEKAFLSEPLQHMFKFAEYSGIFMPDEGRWWKSKLQTVAESIMIKGEKELPLRSGFPVAWERTKKAPIERAKCVFSGESPADWVCYILKEPVMIKYSLSYRPDKRPAVMDECRVSYEAIRTSNEFDERLLDPLGRDLIPKIRRLKKPME